MENIVYHELVRRGYAVFIGKIGAMEVDFVAEKPQMRIYGQVAYKMEFEKTLEREFEPLIAIRDSYPKFVVTMDSHFQDSMKGIRHISLLQFLSDNTLY